MATFYFDLHENGRVIADEEGVERVDLCQVRASAVKAAREVMCAEVSEGCACPATSQLETRKARPC
jgi:hypothetical protein